MVPLPSELLEDVQTSKQQKKVQSISSPKQALIAIVKSMQPTVPIFTVLHLPGHFTKNSCTIFP